MDRLVHIERYATLLRNRAHTQIPAVLANMHAVGGGPRLDFFSLDSPDLTTVVTIYHKDPKQRVLPSPQQVARWIALGEVHFRDARDYFRSIDPGLFADRPYPHFLGITIDDRVGGSSGPGNMVLSTGALTADLGWGIATHEMAHIISCAAWDHEHALLHEYPRQWVNNDAPYHAIGEAISMFFEASRLGVTSYLSSEGPDIFVQELPFAQFLGAGAHRAGAGLAYFLWGVRQTLIEAHGAVAGVAQADRLVYQAIALFGEVPITERLTNEGNARAFGTTIAQLLDDKLPSALPRFVDELKRLGYPLPNPSV